jgi:hypothetical protein
LKDEFSPARRGVERLRKASKSNAAVIEIVDYLEKVLERSPKSIEPPHNKYVALADLADGALEALAIGERPACDIGEDFSAAGERECVPLKIQVLIRRRNPSIAKKHDPLPVVRKLMDPVSFVTLKR